MPKLTLSNTGRYELIDDENGGFEILDTGTGESVTITEGAVSWTDTNEIEYVVSDEGVDRNRATELSDGDSIEIPIPVADGETLKVYRWGAYDASDYTAPTGLDVELVDGGDVVQTAANTTNNQDTTSPVASYTNSTGSVQVFKLRVKNDTGSAIGDAAGDPGIGSHFGYLVEA